MNAYLIDTRISVEIQAHQKSVDKVLGDVMEKYSLKPEDFIHRFPRAIFAERQLMPDIWHLREYEVWVYNGTPEGELAARFRVDVQGKIEYKP